MKKIIIQLLILLSMSGSLVASDVSKESLNQDYKSKSVMELFESLYESTGLNAMINPQEGLVSHGVEVSTFNQGWGRIVMMAVCFTLFYLAIAKGFEPLLLIPIAFGGFLANIPVADIAGPEGFLGILFNMGISSGLFPLMIFMGVGAMTDFGPLLANPKTALLGGAAQLGIFGTVVGAAFLTEYVDFINFEGKIKNLIVLYIIHNTYIQFTLHRNCMKS